MANAGEPGTPLHNLTFTKKEVNWKQTLFQSFFEEESMPIVKLRMPWKEEVLASGSTPEEIYLDFQRQMDEKDRKEGTMTFWDPSAVRNQIAEHFSRNRNAQVVGPSLRD